MTEFTAWEDLSELEQLACEYSDAHKDAYGRRPHGLDANYTVEDYKRELPDLYAKIREDMDREEIEQANNAIDFDLAVMKVIRMGASDYQTALRWMRDGSYYGNEELEYENGLKYGSLGGRKAAYESVFEPSQPAEFEERQAAFLATLHRSFV